MEYAQLSIKNGLLSGAMPTIVWLIGLQCDDGSKVIDYRDFKDFLERWHIPVIIGHKRDEGQDYLIAG